MKSRNHTETNASQDSKLRVYVDTNVLQGAISGRNVDDITFLNRAKEEEWHLYTSTYSLMELLDIGKDREFLIKSVINKWMDVNTFLQKRKSKHLGKDELLEVSANLNNFLVSNKTIQFIDIKEENWNLIKKTAESSNLHSSDVLHLVTAWVGNCRILVTHDDEFIKDGNIVLQEEGVEDGLTICNTDKVDDTLQHVEFRVFLPHRKRTPPSDSRGENRHYRISS